jgi:ABC-type tungstate transport system substrate-binding protein
MAACVMAACVMAACVMAACVMAACVMAAYVITCGRAVTELHSRQVLGGNLPGMQLGNPRHLPRQAGGRFDGR